MVQVVIEAEAGLIGTGAGVRRGLRRAQAGVFLVASAAVGAAGVN